MRTGFFCWNCGTLADSLGRIAVRKNIALLAIFAILFLFSDVFGQWIRKRTTAKKITELIVIDGVIDEGVWADAPEVGEFIQLQPRRGDQAKFQTVVKILYDENFIYFGYLCYDPQPDSIAARLVKRDSDLRPDDSVYVFLDTFNYKESNIFSHSASFRRTSQCTILINNGQSPR